jgi:uracil-DNA glycosylase family 4
MPKPTTAPPGNRLSPNYVAGVGPKPCPVMLVGEGPGKQEDRGVWRSGRMVYEPFVGASGQLLTDILERNGLLRSSIYITNVIKRRIQDDDDPTPAEIAMFRPDLLQELEDVQPEIVIAAGGFATRFFLGPEANLELMHGIPHWSTEFQLPVVPCFHPAAALHDTDQMPAVYWDYEQAVKAVKGQNPIVARVRRVTQIVPLPARDEIDAPFELIFGIDTEDRADGSPLCLTLSWANGLASYVDAANHNDMHQVRALVEDSTIFIHNAMHDLKPLRDMGVDLEEALHWEKDTAVRKTRVIDTMVLLFQQGKIHTQALKTAAYRLLNTQMRSYEDIVGPHQQRLALDYLRTLAAEAWPIPEEIPKYNPETNKITFSRPWGLNRRLERILKDWEQKPDTTDIVTRWENIGMEAKEDALVRFGPMPAADLSHCNQTEAKQYACQDADMTRQLGLTLLPEHEARGLMEIAEIDHGAIPMFERMQRNGMPASRQHFVELGAEMRRLQSELTVIIEAVSGKAVNPNSSDQVADLLYRVMNMPVVKMTPGGKASTGKKSLQHLRDNPMVEWILKGREYGKIDDAFCENVIKQIREVPIDSVSNRIMDACDAIVQSIGAIPLVSARETEERAFYQLMITRVKTGRPAAKQFNVLAIPTRTELGRRVRKGFIARPGHMLGTWDLSQIEMRVCAHESQDPLMLEIYHRDKSFPKWERDLHIITAAMVWGCKGEDVKTEWRTAIKSTGFGILMGITGKGLSDQMRLYGLKAEDWPEDRCDELIRDWLGVYKGVDDFQQQSQAEARRYGAVRDMWGREFLLPHARCPLSWIREEALRQATALKFQAGAQGIEKRAMARLQRETFPKLRAAGYWVEPLVQIHDELVLEFDEDAWPVLHPMMIEALTTTSTMSVPIEAGGVMAKSWGELEK